MVGLTQNPMKTELVLFTRKNVIPEFTLPMTDEVKLNLGIQVQYLGLILDRKLSWKPNIEERAKKTLEVLYCSKSAVGKR